MQPEDGPDDGAAAACADSDDDPLAAVLPKKRASLGGGGDTAAAPGAARVSSHQKHSFMAFGKTLLGSCELDQGCKDSYLRRKGELDLAAARMVARLFDKYARDARFRRAHNRIGLIFRLVSTTVSRCVVG